MVVGLLGGADADRVFHALADATRRDILTRVIREEQSVSALARHYPMSLTAVQKHVSVLERAALVTKERRGREQVVHIDVTVLSRAARLLDAYEQLWRHRARSIEQILAEGRESDREPDREGE
ncbi:ArsR/SmtB family transcription factor [Planosporangium mesophilum]|nr:metalloregulator ArsR/SmtB family transcription factor [Planosporangium mesophilum]NJC82842.1 winged helix-turn-helix transcriptional regulator [Planosporangium mesophilum]